jgi:hypothetical protein
MERDAQVERQIDFQFSLKVNIKGSSLVSSDLPDEDLLYKLELAAMIQLIPKIEYLLSELNYQAKVELIKIPSDTKQKVDMIIELLQTINIE